MMTAAQIRQSFLDFFKSKQHTIVPSDNVGYTSRDGGFRADLTVDEDGLVIDYEGVWKRANLRER